MFHFQMIRLRFRKYFLIIGLIAFGLWVCYKYNKFVLRIQEQEIKDKENISNETNHATSAPVKVLINPPRFISRANKEQLFDLSKAITSKNVTEKEITKSKLYSLLSDVTQTQLASLQLNCSGPNILCGYFDPGCGLGCQIHHRVICLIVSYALGVPLIHDERNWAYNDTWSSTFLHLGSQCQVGPETYVLKWKLSRDLCWFNIIDNIVILKDNKQISRMDIQGYNSTCRTKNTNYRIEYPLKNGIPVSKEIADLVEIISPFPFIWWVGQFMKFALRLNPEMQDRIQRAKAEINYSHPIVGLHVRRTDKVRECKECIRPLEHYMHVADEYYNNHSNSTDEKLHLKRVFIASEDAGVFRTAKIKYPNWNIIGFNSRKTRQDPNSRHGGLFEIVTDLFLLLESDFIVCCFSSNICRLLYEMQSFFHTDGKSRLKSLTGNYYYLLHGHLNILKILKIDNDSSSGDFNSGRKVSIIDYYYDFN